ncbi:MAG TPA: asparagine synthase-related protein [Nitrospirota bacterium]|nr:asparagine synthase-related protein [Nitrospirota bacterium]
MPGIAGIISKANPIKNKSNLDQMINVMMHEANYVSGSYSNVQLGIYAGWVCHQGSFSDCMPLVNEKKSIYMIFAGEDFADNEKIQKLGQRGYKFDRSNAKYIISLYEEKGDRFLVDLNGWFAGVLIDLRQNKVVLFNDRYGMRRIYFYETKDAFYFSSEAKSLLKILSELRQLDMRGFAETISCGCVLQNRTLFAGIGLLPGGSSWVIDKNGSIRKGKYFNLETWEKQPFLNDMEFYETLKETFTRILPRYFQGKERIAMSLTGGLDCRIILAWAKSPPGGLPCYSFSSNYRDSADVKIARKVAKNCGQTHETIVIDEKFHSEFPRMAEKAIYVSDGTMDVSGSVELYVNRLASGIAPIRLTGNYGSEILRGNVAFKPFTRDDKLFEPAFSELVSDASTTYYGESQCHNLSFIAFKQVPWHHHARFSVEQSQLTLRSPYLDNDLVALMYRAPSNHTLSKQFSLQLIAEGNVDLSKIPTDRGVLYRHVPGIGRIQHLYAEFVAKTEYAFDYGMPQWLAGIDHFLAPLHIERLFLGRNKFYHFRVWYRDRLSQFVKDVLLDPRTLARPYLNSRRLEAIVRNHYDGKRNYTREINQVLTSELVQRQLIE